MEGQNLTVESVDFIPAYAPREEAQRRLKRIARDLVLRDLDYEISKAPEGSDLARFLHRVRLAVFE